MRIGEIIELEPSLVEESVLLVSDASSPATRRQYRRERNAIYEIPEPEKREDAFQELDARWFRRLGLGAPLLRLLREFESVLSRVSRCIVLPAGRSRDEGADLHDTRETMPALAIKLTPQSLANFEGIAPALRGELLHVEDMLDPAFGYERELPTPEEGEVYEKLLRDRYRVLWNTTVDGRLAARGRLAEGGEARRRREFMATFPALGTEVEKQFERFFRGHRPSHHELLSFARSVEGKSAGRCPLCRFPTTRFLGEAEPLDPRVEESIRRDFSTWSPSQGVCVQCADLYEARAFARSVSSGEFRVMKSEFIT